MPLPQDERSVNDPQMGQAPPQANFLSVAQPNAESLPTYDQNAPPSSATGQMVGQQQQSPGSPTSKIKSVLSNFFTNFMSNQGMSAEQSAQIALQRNQQNETIPLIREQVTAARLANQRTQAAIQAFSQPSPSGESNYGPLTQTVKQLGELKPEEKAEFDSAWMQSKMSLSMEPMFQAMSKVTQQRHVENMMGGSNLSVDPVTGQPVKQILNKGGKVMGQVATTLPGSLAENENNWIAKANSGDPVAQQKVAALQANRIQVARERGAAFAQARADNTPYPVFDAAGGLTTVSASEAIKQGYPSAQVWNTVFGPTGSTKSQAQAAGAVAEHIPAFQQAVRNLAAKGELGAVTGRLNTFLTKGYGGDDPDIAEFVTTAGLLKTGAVRAHFGAKGGAQVLGTFDNYLNTAQEPNALIGSSNAILSFLKTYKSVGTATGPGGNAPPAKGAVTPKPNQPKWNAVKGVYE